MGLLLAGCSSEQASVTEAPAAEESAEKVMAYARFVPERRDDFAWENDKVAFRVYGPAAPLAGHASGVDAWLKKVDYSIIDKWYAGFVNGISYHEDRGEGYDPYHTGISRGVGGSAVWVDGKPYYGHNFDSYEVIQSGGDEVVFTLHYAFETPLGNVEELKTVSLELGSQLYKVDSTFTLNGEATSLPIALGLATHDEKASVYSNEAAGWISAWEVIDELGLGTGVIIDPAKVTSIAHMPIDEKDESHIWLFTNTDDNGQITYYAGFGWEGAGEITTLEQWHQYLDSFPL
ncbi:DUF4861 domain-containing protein [Alteromonas aestuariivivens]|uniref:DUF4861 domain-containing protein n=2 Tax=Alteromonas aestuariivivens TaxID=1938339 RepID=A0A3D8M7G5_9ALTE|nr:DUF4861 domain-containing protein [Alteromonas aestuariivivens]